MNTQKPTIDKLLTIKQAGERYGVSRSYLYKKVEIGELGAYKVGRRLMFEESELHEHLIKRLEPVR